MIRSTTDAEEKVLYRFAELLLRMARLPRRAFHTPGRLPEPRGRAVVGVAGGIPQTLGVRYFLFCPLNRWVIRSCDLLQFRTDRLKETTVY